MGAAAENPFGPEVSNLIQAICIDYDEGKRSVMVENCT
jgi:hypothetical protein